MMRLHHRFVEDIPDILEPKTLYIALDCGAVVHLCACGCGNEAVTPLGPTDWSVTYNGETISLSPSVGNWSFPCQSHYFIKADTIQWAPKWSKEQIGAGRSFDQSLKTKFNEEHKVSKSKNKTNEPVYKLDWLRRLIGRLFR